ncbi:39S ribosomal protein L23, mitochondrial [Takifugu flavidus]|uniref:39S ribosomal protein L23, mitochondrial n=1 Tax=Takifugu flavidus TaxID=433684 RepID=A0A5C6P9W2_9TELE|nr:39S ribosomal protein L23, mitochondrial [Takifugu flavidus]
MLADGENVSTPILCHLGTQACHVLTSFNRTCSPPHASTSLSRSELPLAPYHVCVLDSAFLDGSETPRIGFQAQGQTFTFPDIFPTKERAVAEGSMEELQEKFMEDEKQRQKPDPRRGGVTEWFGL